MKTIIITGVCLLLVLASWACAQKSPEQRLTALRKDIRERYPDVKTITTQELSAWLRDTNRPPPVLLDVREEVEYAVSHLKGARRVEPGEPSAALFASLKPDTPVVAYCAVGERSARFARDLQENGFTNVYNLDGSIFQWANEDRPVFSGDSPAQQVHPYSRVWGQYLKQADGLRQRSRHQGRERPAAGKRENGDRDRKE